MAMAPSNRRSSRSILARRFSSPRTPIHRMRQRQMRQQIWHLVRETGALRVMLMVLVLGLIALAPFSGGSVRVDGWAIVPTLLAPALYVVMVFVLPLEMVMSLIFMSDKQGPERRRFQRILAIELALFLVLLAVWAPFLVALLGNR